MEQNPLLRSDWVNPPHCITVFTEAPTDPCSEPEDPLPPFVFLGHLKIRENEKRPENITRVHHL
jgi:hypothetical protein